MTGTWRSWTWTRRCGRCVARGPGGLGLGLHPCLRLCLPLSSNQLLQPLALPLLLSLALPRPLCTHCQAVRLICKGVQMGSSGVMAVAVVTVPLLCSGGVTGVQ